MVFFWQSPTPSSGIPTSGIPSKSEQDSGMWFNPPKPSVKGYKLQVTAFIAILPSLFFFSTAAALWIFFNI